MVNNNDGGGGCSNGRRGQIHTQLRGGECVDMAMEVAVVVVVVTMVSALGDQQQWHDIFLLNEAVVAAVGVLSDSPIINPSHSSSSRR